MHNMSLIIFVSKMVQSHVSTVLSKYSFTAINFVHALSTVLERMNYVYRRDRITLLKITQIIIKKYIIYLV